jgi:hypothetical protein
MNRRVWVVLAAVAAILVIAGIIVARRTGIPQPAPAAIRPAAPAPAAPSAAAPQAAPQPIPLAPFACRFPDSPPRQPDGATASAAEMQASHDAIQHYVELLEAFQACRNKQIDDPSLPASLEQKRTWLNEGNAAVDQANELAAQFSAQLKVWRARNPGK